MIVTFDRIGRNHRVPSLTIDDGLDPDAVAEIIHKHARPYLPSREVEVIIGGDRVQILVGGFRNGGEGKIVR